MNKTISIKSAKPPAPAKTHLNLFRVIKAARRQQRSN
jgi:hypothetical protein